MLWVVEQRKLWGDLGSILISGMARREAEAGPLLVKRTGPFLPPLSMPWYGPEGRRVVVSDEFRRRLEGAEFPSLQFGAVAFPQVVRLAWHKWDLSADEPAQYPECGGPESYIDDQPHDRRAAAAMPAAWELLSPVFPLHLERRKSPRGGYLDRFRAEEETPVHPGLFLSRATYGHLVVGEPGRVWLAQHVGGWVRFCEVEPPSAEPGAAP